MAALVAAERLSPRRIVADEMPKPDAHILAQKQEAQKQFVFKQDVAALQSRGTALAAKDLGVHFDTAAFRAFLGGDFSQAEEVHRETHGRRTAPR